MEDNIPSRLFKLRSLCSCEDFDRTQEIIERGQFWFSRFWELNDPMEGVYTSIDGEPSESIRNKLFQQKSARAICSFSGQSAACSPMMWGYYAGGFRGIAIEITPRPNAKVFGMHYPVDLHTFNDSTTADAILTTKTKAWEHEDEYRFLDDKRGWGNVGKIVAIHFGNPLTTTDHDKISRDELGSTEKYLRYRTTIEALAKREDIPWHEARVSPDGRSVVLEQTTSPSI